MANTLPSRPDDGMMALDTVLGIVLGTLLLYQARPATVLGYYSQKSIQLHATDVSGSEQSIMVIEKAKKKHEKCKRTMTNTEEEQTQSETNASQLINQKKKKRLSSLKQTKKKMMTLKLYQVWSHSSPITSTGKKLVVNLHQDSKDEHAKIQGTIKVKSNSDNVFDNIREYFHAAVQVDKDTLDSGGNNDTCACAMQAQLSKIVKESRKTDVVDISGTAVTQADWYGVINGPFELPPGLPATNFNKSNAVYAVTLMLDEIAHKIGGSSKMLAVFEATCVIDRMLKEDQEEDYKGKDGKKKHPQVGPSDPDEARPCGILNKSHIPLDQWKQITCQSRDEDDSD
ncbi:hypothetical protein DFH28DRAFT_927710 [Melampsora americana]|nr:hypothetical protein DFH28DRAFT_927710 [Melampsora americana]